jgi:UDP-N-acetylglucosamine 1-carboxyvinyltransferase
VIFDSLKIRGGKKLKGDVYPIPNKNALVAVLPAAILSDQESVFHGVSKTSDVEKLLQILRLLGATVDDTDYSSIKISGKNLSSYRIDRELGGQFRAPLMFVGPLLARFGRAEVPLPGGCVLGERSIAVHIDGFRKLGVIVEFKDGLICFAVPDVSDKTKRVWLKEASVTATESLVMYAVGSGQEVEVIDAACEPHVVDTFNFLGSMGAKISGIGSNWIKTNKTKELGGGDFRPRPDFVDIAGLMVAAAVTDGNIRIKGANDPDIVDGLIDWFEAFNVSVIKEENDLLVKRNGDLRIDLSKASFPMAAKNLPKLVPRPWPGFPVDVIPAMVTLLCKSEGRMLLQNWMYESGLDFVREMNMLGADILMMDPQRVLINGPVKFKGGELFPPAVIQACKALLLAALADDVETIIHGAGILRRRYPDIVETYRSLGAEIEVV